MGINQIIYGDKELINLRNDTVDEEHLVSGYTAHDRHGNAITGTNMFDCNSADATATADKIANGYVAYSKGERIIGTNTNDSDTTDATATAADITKDKTAYVKGSKVTGTNILATEIKSADVKDGVKIYKTSTEKQKEDGTPMLTGTYTSDGTITAERVVAGDIGYSKGKKITGTAINYGSINKTITSKDQVITLEKGFYGKSTVKIDENSKKNIASENIRMGVSILGTVGELDMRTPTIERETLPNGGIHILIQKPFYEFETDFTNDWYAVFTINESTPQLPLAGWNDYNSKNGMICYAKSEDAILKNFNASDYYDSSLITNYTGVAFPSRSKIGYEIVAKWPDTNPFTDFNPSQQSLIYSSAEIDQNTDQVTYLRVPSMTSGITIPVVYGTTQRVKNNLYMNNASTNPSGDILSVNGYRYGGGIKPIMLKIAFFKTGSF